MWMWLALGGNGGARALCTAPHSASSFPGLLLDLPWGRVWHCQDPRALLHGHCGPLRSSSMPALTNGQEKGGGRMEGHNK